jgi:hypothetical protein
MKTVNRDELFQNLSGFLKSKGIELKSAGSYTQRIQKGCGLLADAVNATQKTVRRAKAKADETLDHLRQSIHEATAPKPPPIPKTEPKAERAKPTKRAPVKKKSARK